jgi:bacillithiol system protein YtxJ
LSPQLSVPLYMNWKNLTSPEQLAAIKEESKSKPVIIFKHSTRCSISSTAKNRFERQWPTSGLDGVSPYYLDLLMFRDLSNRIASDFNVMHESPQLLLIQDGECVYNASHLSIKADDLQLYVS